MKFTSYLASLLPSFSRDQVVEDLDTIADELRSHVLPPYKTVVKEFGTRKFHSESAEALEAVFSKNLKYKYKGNHLSGIYLALQGTDEHVKLLQKLVDDNFALDITHGGLNTIRVNVMQLVEVIAFTVRYSRRHLNYILTCESINHSGESLDDAFSKGELEWLKSGRDAFINGLNILSMDSKELETKFKDIPNVLVNAESIEATQALLGKNKTDPFQMRFVPLVLNPIYHVRMRVAEYQAAKYREAVEERGLIELRLLLLKEQDAGRTNVKLTKQIDYNEGRLQKLVYKVERLGGHDDD